jgi:hypothetical protein
MEVRRYYSVVEEVHEEGGRPLERPLKRVAVAAVILNPYAGRYEEDLSLLYTLAEELGKELGQRAVALLGGDAPESFGKAAIVGVDGEREHAAAMMHPTLGGPLRKAVSGGKAIIPSAKKLGGPGASIDIPLHYKDAMFVRSHFDGMELRIPDAPRADEIVIAIAVTNGGRPHARVGGLRKEEARGEDGLR